MKKRRLPSKDFWAKALPRIIKRGFANDRERELAADFRSCAVAESRAVFGYKVVAGLSARPEDDTLSDLGCMFYDQINNGDGRGAAATYAVIQGRARELQLKRKFKV